MRRQRFIIPPEPFRISVLFICALVSGIGAVRGVKSTSAVVADPWFICVVASIGVILFSKNYTVDRIRITERILFFPIHSIRWEYVGQVMAFQKTNDDERTKGESIFVITMIGCEPFDPDKETIGTYIKRYNRLLTKIVVSKNAREKYISVFREIFGPVVVYD